MYFANGKKSLLQLQPVAQGLKKKKKKKKKVARKPLSKEENDPIIIKNYCSIPHISTSENIVIDILYGNPGNNCFLDCHI